MLLETIRCENGVALHLSYHQARLDQSLRTLNCTHTYDLKSLITPPICGTYRCRFLYDETTYTVEFHPYVPRTFTSLKLIHSNMIEYPLKYAHREALNTLFELRGECDDILIVKNGLLSDTTIANIALKIDGQWLTPISPLLFGTTRERLIQEKYLLPSSLTPDDIARATNIAIMNAMVGFIEVENGIIS